MAGDRHKQRYPIWIPPELHAQLKAAAEEKGMAVAALAREILTKALARKKKE